MVFGDAQARADLEAIIHPRVREATGTLARPPRRGRASPWPSTIPLLYETGRDGDFDRAIATSCPRIQQVARVVERDGLTAAQPQARIDRAAADRREVQRADFVIDTGGTFGDTNRQVDRAVEKLLELASRRRTLGSLRQLPNARSRLPSPWSLTVGEPAWALEGGSWRRGSPRRGLLRPPLCSPSASRPSAVRRRRGLV